jgi:hypothetical protein
METLIRLAGLFGLPAVILYIGYLFYDKNELISISLIVIGVILTVYIIYSEIGFKRKRHEKPLLFKEYKGE